MGMTFLPPPRTQTGQQSRQREPQSQTRCGLTPFGLLSHTLSKDSIFWGTFCVQLSQQRVVLFVQSPRMSGNLFVKMTTTDSFWVEHTPRGEPVNYVEPPTINVDMFTDLVHQHTHVHRHNWSTISALTGAANICGLICSDLTPVCADTALFLCVYPSEHETPSGARWPRHELLRRTLWGKKALLSFVIAVIYIPTNHWCKMFAKDRASHCGCRVFISDAPRWGMWF